MNFSVAIIVCSTIVGVVRIPQATQLAFKTSQLAFLPPSLPICLALMAYLLPLIPCTLSVILAARGLNEYALQVHVFTFGSLVYLDWVRLPRKAAIAID